MEESSKLLELIPHDNILLTLEKMLEVNTIVVVEGEDGIGKTTLLSQFADRHNANALRMFLRPLKLAYDPEILKMDLAMQIYKCIHGREPASDIPVDAALYRRLTFDLGSYARRKRELFYFIIDGLEEVRQREPLVVEQIIDLLPIGSEHFRFLIAEEVKTLPSPVTKTLSVKAYQLSGFSLDETVRYLDDLALPRSTVEAIYKSSRGIPGHLASIRRILSAQVEVDLTELPPTLTELFEIEWRRVHRENDLYSRALALVTFSRSPRRVADVARLLGSEPDEVERFLSGFPFLVFTHDGPIAFVSEPFRKYAAEKLRSFKRDAMETVIADLSQQPQSEDAMLYLPAYLSDAGKYDQLLEYLSPDHFSVMLGRSASLRPIRERAELGISTALKQGRDADLLRLTVQKTALSEVDKSAVWRSEVEALLALKDYAGAVTLAQNTQLRESRLHLLVLVAKTKREHGLSPEPELKDEISRLYSEVDHQSLGERASEIAGDLLYVSPELAIDLLEKSTKTSAATNSLDWTFAKLSLAAFGDANRAGTQMQAETAEKLRSKIANPALKDFIAAVRLYVGKYSASEVVAEAKKLTSVAEQLLFLSGWTSVRGREEDATEVVEYALTMAIRTTDYAPNTHMFRELAMALPSIENERKLRELIGSFDSQKATVERLGPTEEYLRLQLLLAAAELRLDFPAAANRVVGAYYYSGAVQDLSVKAECLGWILTFLIEHDAGGRLEKQEGLRSIVTDELDRTVDELLRLSAEHYDLTRGIVNALVPSAIDRALAIIRRLNTENRRNRALVHLVEESVAQSDSNIDWSLLNTTMQEFTQTEAKDEAVMTAVERLHRVNDPESMLNSGGANVVEQVVAIADAFDRCRACSLAYSILVKSKSPAHADIAEKVLAALTPAWKAIDVGWNRVDAGFQITKVLADCSTGTARQHLKDIADLRQEILLDIPTTAWAYIYCVRLALRMYIGLLRVKGDTKQDLERMQALINKIPSSGERAILWSDIARGFYISKRHEDCQRIVSAFVRPLLQDISAEDHSYRARIIVLTAPVLYVVHHVTAMEILQGMTRSQRDRAVAE